MTTSEPDGERAAGIITRGLAAVIDLVVVLLIMGALYGGLVLVRLVYSPTAFSLPSLNAVFSTVVTFAVAVLYLTGCWTVSGSTAGAVTMGLRVVGRRSPRVSLLVGLLRSICCVLFPVGLLWIALDRQRRSLQDIVFRTRVIYLRGAR
ncbi:RDD family protein [Mycolicibacterium tusciae]|uniref:RDD family protein n=1 Tax=Mycolicibacterium tusciae TaxID=75922 RepID=A0A1X0JIM0_9MYCO|nr:RDD family protein [Mycolicibacterium tusciae]ORB62490.1 RDD family protein [Mycolicibacterium tusciae]